MLNENMEDPGSSRGRQAASTTSAVSEGAGRADAPELDAVITGRLLQREADLSLLRAHEPVVRFTRGELFFPTAVGPYVAQCSPWAEDIAGETRCIVPAGRLTLERLCAEAVAHSSQALSLRFVQAPLRRKEYRRWRHMPRPRILATSRFTTTGMLGRIMEAGFRGSLLLRGTVARGLAAAAEVTYREQLRSDRFPYYGRVVRIGGYLCLQYWFFYAMNDWRSTFKGVNDHEADWEMVTVYLAESQAGPPRPTWVAFSSHDHHGDDLRRRWDDPDLRRFGQHPVVFAGAGSHSGAFVPGDYVISVNPPRLRKAIDIARRLQRLLAPWREQSSGAAGLGIPFVDSRGETGCPWDLASRPNGSRASSMTRPPGYGTIAACGESTPRISSEVNAHPRVPAMSAMGQFAELGPIRSVGRVCSKSPPKTINSAYRWGSESRQPSAS